MAGFDGRRHPRGQSDWPDPADELLGVTRAAALSDNATDPKKILEQARAC